MGNLDQMVKVNRGRNKHLKKSKSRAVLEPPPEPVNKPTRKKRRVRLQHLPPELQTSKPEVEHENAGVGVGVGVGADVGVDVRVDVGDELEIDVETELEVLDNEEFNDSPSYAPLELSEPSYTPELRRRILSTPPVSRTRTPEYEYDTSIPGTVLLDMSASLRGAYAAEKPPDQPLRSYLVERLEKCREHTSDKSLYLTEYDLQYLSRKSGRNFDTVAELMQWIDDLSSLNVSGVGLRLDTDLLDRVVSRKDPDQSIGDCLSEYLAAGIEIKTGMR
jgi:hypothetical protein